MEKFDTHKFLYTLYHNNNIEGHKIIYINKENSQIMINIKNINIGHSPIACTIYDDNNKKHKIIFLRIKQIYYKDELVWDNTDININTSKIIKGYK
ncbi:MAG: hypothetical protein ACOC16_00550 [Nanoarchaeota archaeon]